MTARPDALLVALADLGAHVQDIREIVSAVNNDDYAMPKDTISMCQTGSVPMVPCVRTRG